MPNGYVKALKGVTHSTKSGCGGLVAETPEQSTASRSERRQNDVGMREQQPTLPGKNHKWNWYVPVSKPVTHSSRPRDLEIEDNWFKVTAVPRGR